MATKTDHHVRVDGLNVRYLEEGRGPAVLLLHGSALGSSAEVWERHLGPLAANGLRVIAYDRQGFGKTDDPTDGSPSYQQQFVLRFIDALELERVGIVGHSQTGNFAIGLGLEHPDRVTRIMVLGTGSLLPPLEGVQPPPPGEGENVEGREPTRDDVRGVLEAQLYNHSLITPELVEARYRMSLGHNRARPAGGGGPRSPQVPLWQRVGELKVPITMMYGKDDRGQVDKRLPLLRERYPNLEITMVDNCKHLIQLDAEDQFLAAAGKFFRG